MLVREGHVDRDFVAAHTVGFEQMQSVVADYPPERVAKPAGEPVGPEPHAPHP